MGRSTRTDNTRKAAFRQNLFRDYARTRVSNVRAVRDADNRRNAPLPLPIKFVKACSSLARAIVLTIDDRVDANCAKTTKTYAAYNAACLKVMDDIKTVLNPNPEAEKEIKTIGLTMGTVAAFLLGSIVVVEIAKSYLGRPADHNHDAPAGKKFEARP